LDAAELVIERLQGGDNREEIVGTGNEVVRKAAFTESFP
jgi:hypothetical protein